MTRKAKFHGPQKKPYHVYALTCDCDADRIVVDARSNFYCAECMSEMDKANGAELPDDEQRNIEVKLQFRNRIADEAEK